MKKRITQIVNSPFVKNVAVMATGAAGAQGVTMVFSPIITRLYGPEAFGTLGTFTALTRVIIPIAALTYPIAIVLPKSDKNAKGIIKLSLITSLITAFVTTIILLFFNKRLVRLFQLEEIAPYLYLIPLVIIFAGLMQITEQWLIRTNQFAINAKVNFLQSVIINGSKVGIGFIYPVAVVLVLLQVAANGLRAFMMITFAKKSSYRTKEDDKKEKQLSIRELAKKYYDFPLYRAPEELFSSVSQNIPVLLLTTFFGPASAGFYNIGRTVLGLPSRLIGQSIGDVFYPRITKAANNKENVTKLIIKATLALLGLGIIPFGLIIFFGPFLFELVFGQDWYVAGEYARWVALSSYSTFINKPSVRSMPVLAAQGFHLIFSIIKFIVRSLSLIFGFVVFESDTVAVALFGITSCLLNVVLILITLNMSKRKF